MGSDDMFVQGLKLFIHQDAIDEGTVKIVDELGIEVEIEGEETDSWLLINAAAISKMNKTRAKISLTTTYGGGFFTVDGDPDRVQFPYYNNDRKSKTVAKNQARDRAEELYDQRRGKK